MKPILIAVAFAVALAASPIPVSGGGVWTRSPPAQSDNAFFVQFSGSDGINSVSACINAGGPGASDLSNGTFIGISSFAGVTTGSVSIDGQGFQAGFFLFGLGVGTGTLSGYDARSTNWLSAKISVAL